MDHELSHHGIKGMRWGVRRTPEQLGHTTRKSSSKPSLGARLKGAMDKLPKKKKKTSELTDEELRSRINRLNMEEQYNNLLARQKERNTSSISKKISKALDSFGDKTFEFVVNKSFNALFGEKKFDIDKYKTADVNTMDSDTISKVAKWYANANSITNARKTVPPPATPSKKSKGSGTP